MAFSISPKLGADAVVKVELSGSGATTDDYTGLKYSFDSGTSWTSITSGSLLTLPKDLTGFQLKTIIKTDAISPEAGESVVFVVQQTATTTSLTDSWWVSATVPITDVAPGTSSGGGTPPAGASTTKITADAASSNVTEGLDAYAVAKFSLAAALNTEAKVNIFLYGWNTTLGTDTDGFEYRTSAGSDSTATAWQSVPSNGVVTIAAGKTKLEARTKIVNDSVVEQDESMVFVVQQVSNNLTDSWYVNHTAIIKDASTAGPGGSTVTVATPSTISAVQSVVTVNEGQEAIATFKLDRALAGTALVKIVLTSWDATAGSGKDYDGVLSYRMGDSGIWTTAPNLSQIMLADGISKFQLKTNTLADNITPEQTETLEFVVVQDANAKNLVNSWWSSALVKILDVPSTSSGGSGTAANVVNGTNQGSTLVGTSTIDTFKFSLGNTDNTVTDFASGVDKLDLSSALLSYNGVNAGSFVKFEISGSDTAVSVSPNGSAGAFTNVVTLTGVSGLTVVGMLSAGYLILS